MSNKWLKFNEKKILEAKFQINSELETNFGSTPKLDRLNEGNSEFGHLLEDITVSKFKIEGLKYLIDLKHK